MSGQPLSGALHCRRGTADDAEVITRFNLQLAQETEDKTLDAETIRQGVLGGLQRFPEAQYFVAESQGSVAGQLMITREWSDWRNGWMLWLQSVYVDQEFRRQGVFRQLLQYALETVSADSDAVGLRLYVERDNQAARSVYDQLGFADGGYQLLEMVPLKSV